MKTAEHCAVFVVCPPSGRLTKGQQLALDSYWPVMGVEYQAAPVDLNTLFGREAPIVLEIGFGMGTSLVTMATNNPQQNF